MRALKFKLSGKTAFFKQPDVNTYCYYTYNNIHRVALLGIFGAIMGYKGYNKQKKEVIFPEFYEKLKDLKVAICPLNESGYIPKKIQIFNNSVGYASKEEGGNLIIKEQWLESPIWEIAFLIEKEQDEVLAERLLHQRFEFLPYLGKNDHFATIDQSEILHVLEPEMREEITLKSLYPKALGTIAEKTGIKALRYKGKEWKYEERLPVELDSDCNQYRTELMVFTNKIVTLDTRAVLYQIKDEKMVFV
ncbi:MAG: type I-B CRISPR-associated protein Cas5b [Eubacterium sp.]